LALLLKKPSLAASRQISFDQRRGKYPVYVPHAIGSIEPHCERDKIRRRVEALASQVASITRAAAYSATPESTSSVVCAPGLLDGEILQPIMVSVMGIPIAVPGELVRVNLNMPTGMSLTSDVQLLLNLEIEPFIVGVGKVKVDNTPNGIVVRRVDARKDNNRHIEAPVEITLEMIKAGVKEFLESRSLLTEEPQDAVEAIFRAMDLASRESSVLDA
jgi:hypothetical protein